MIAFEVYVNGEYAGTAGVGDLGVLSTTLTWVRRSPENSADGKSFEEELELNVGGMSQIAHLTWLHRHLVAGDNVSVNIVVADKVDVPRSSQKRDDAASVEEGERHYLKYLLKKYGAKKPKSTRRSGKSSKANK